MSDELFSIHDAASLLKVSTKTLRRWDKKGVLVPSRTQGNQRRYTYDQIEAFRNKDKKEAVVQEAQPKFQPSSILDLSSQESSLPTILSPRPSAVQKKIIFAALLMFIAGLAASFFAGAPLPFLADDSKKDTSKKVRSDYANKKSVLGEAVGGGNLLLNVNIPSAFKDSAEFIRGLAVTDIATLSGGLRTDNQNIDAGTGTVTASNVLYGLTVGDGLSVGTGQTPTITNTGVLSIGGKTGAVSLSAGSGISISDVTITNSDKGSSQNIFKTITVGSSDIAADGNSDTLTLSAGTGITLSANTSTDTVTISGSSDSGWTDDGTVVRLTTSTDTVGIGTASPSTTLHVVGTSTFTSTSSFNGDVTLGDATSDTLTLYSRITVGDDTTGNALEPTTGSKFDLGSSTRTWRRLYVDTLNVGSDTSIAGTNEDDFRINADNATADAENSTLSFERGTPATNAVLTWRATGTPSKLFSFNAPFWINPDTGIDYSGTAALIVDQPQSQDVFTASASATTRFRISNAGHVLPGTDNSYDLGSSTLGWRNIYLAGQIFSGSSGTVGHWQRASGSLAPTNITDDILVGATATSSAFVKLSGTSGNDSWINTGNVGIGTTAPDARLEINHATGDILRMTYNDSDGSATNYTDFSLDSVGGLTIAGSAATIASSATAEKTTLTITPPTVTLTGTTQVTSQMDSILFNAPTITDSSAVTVDSASTFTINGAPSAGGSVTLTNPYALSILDGTVRQDITAAGALRVVSSITNANLDIGHTVYVSGNYAYLTSFSTSRLLIIDITNPASPLVVGSVGGMNTIRGVAVAGRYAYVASFGDDTFNVIDVSNPNVPSIVGSLTDSTFLDEIYWVAVVGRYAYVNSIGATDYFSIIDISDPTNPTRVGSVTHATIGDPRGISVSGNYAYVVSSIADALTIIDISDPSSPSVAGSIAHATNLDGAVSVNVSGQYAYVHSSTSNIFTVVDVSDPTTPTIAGTVTDADLANGRPGTQFVAGRYAYVGGFNTDTLVVIDISDPTSPSVAAKLTDSTNLDAPHALFVAGKYVYIGTENPQPTGSRFTIVDISGLDVPAAHIGSLTTSNLRVSGNIDIESNLYVRSGLNVGPAGFSSQGPSSIYASSPATALTIIQDSTGDILNLFDGSTEVFTVLDGGNVGIGTTAPDARLEINHATGDILRMTYNDSDGSATNYTDFSLDANGTMTVLSSTKSIASGTESAIIFDSGDLTITGASTSWLQNQFLKADVTAATALTITNAATVYIDDAPDDIGAGPATITNKYALWVDAGDVRMDGTVSVGLSNTASSTAVCSSLGNDTDPTSGTAYELRDCDTAPATDYMEFYAAEQGIETGDIVVPGSVTIERTDGKKEAKLAKSTSSYQTNLLGIVSDPALATDFNSIGKGMISSADNPVPVALSGRVPVKVSLENGAIRVGNWITSSSQPGVGMKATEPGQVIGMALGSISETDFENCGIENSLKIENCELKIGKIIVFINPHWSLGTYEIAMDGNLQSPSVILSPAQLGEGPPTNVGFSNELRDSSASPQNDSGIASDPLFRDLSDRVSLLETKIDEIAASASTSAFLNEMGEIGVNVGEVWEAKDATVSGTLNVLGRATVTDLGVTGSISAGLLAINGLDGEINTLAGPLKLQSLGLGGIDILAGKIVIDTEGNVKISGDINVSGNIKAEGTITAKKINIDTEDKESASLGSEVLPANQISVSIFSTSATADSKIFVTATTPTGNRTLFVKEKTEGVGFTVAIESEESDSGYDKDIGFDWWIVN